MNIENKIIKNNNNKNKTKIKESNNKNNNNNNNISKNIEIKSNNSNNNSDNSSINNGIKEESFEIITKSSNVSNLIDSWLTGSSFLEKFKEEEENQKDDILSKYTTLENNKSISQDPNQNIHVKNSSPFHLLDNNKNSKNNNNNKSNNNSNSNNSNNNKSSGNEKLDISKATKNQLDNILNNNNKKQKNFITSQNNNHLFRSHPYSKGGRHNGSNEDEESRSSSIGKFKSNSTPKKASLFD